MVVTIESSASPTIFALTLPHHSLFYHYPNIYSNDGALTQGVDEVTLDGFSHQRVTSIIARLKAGTYRFKPVRRTYIRKANGKKRPLGVSSGDDKLVQEVVRMISSEKVPLLRQLIQLEPEVGVQPDIPAVPVVEPTASGACGDRADRSGCPPGPDRSPGRAGDGRQ